MVEWFVGDAHMFGSILGVMRRCLSAAQQVSVQGSAIALASPPAPTVHVAQLRFADVAFAGIELQPASHAVPSGTPTPFASVAALALILSGSLDQPVVADPATDTAARQHGPRRPLAAQLAVTAARNVRKGMKNRGFTVPQSRVQKAKPAARKVVKKQAPKRRHVWLSTQVRVVRPIATNVITLTRPTRSATRVNNLKAPLRPLRLAA